ncbi:MAG: MerR family transcriptional regulator [Acidimicrobiales bacterium]
MTDERVRTQATFQIGEVATRVGLSQRTIRHYDDLGIIKPSARTAGGFRLYTESDVQRFLLIKPFKSLGVGLEEAAP